MKETFAPLSAGPLAAGATYVRRVDETAHRVTLTSPALEVMTDLLQVQAATVEPNVSIDAALERMKHAGVRLLLVANNQHELLGIVTARDLQGERPVRFQTEIGVKRAEVLVRDVMTPRDLLEVIALRDVERSQVGNVVATLKRMGRQHALVADGANGRLRVRGLFSTTRIGRQLGVTLDVEGQAHTFAELEAALRS
jgi:CBS domain-containing protein